MVRCIFFINFFFTIYNSTSLRGLNKLSMTNNVFIFYNDLILNCHFLVWSEQLAVYTPYCLGWFE